MDRDQRREITQLIRETIVETVPAVVDQVLERFGFTVEDVPSMQQDMAHLRRSRIGTEKLKEAIIKASIKAAVGTAIAGGLWALWQGIRLSLRQ